MENKDKKVKEPYSPEETPRPPQIIDPNARKDRENPIEEKTKKKTPAESRKSGTKKKPELGDEPEIHDETTI
jgi:hypothetical protein